MVLKRQNRWSICNQTTDVEISFIKKKEFPGLTYLDLIFKLLSFLL